MNSKVRVALFMIDGFEETEALATVDILRHVAADVDSRRISQELAPYVIRALHALPLEDSFVELLDVLTEKPHADRIFNMLIRMGLQLIRTQVFQEMLRENIASIRTGWNVSRLRSVLLR